MVGREAGLKPLKLCGSNRRWISFSRAGVANLSLAGRGSRGIESDLMSAGYNKHDVLSEITFGHRIAEDESDSLASYFVETDQWKKVLSGEVDVVYGPKGSGKSALFSLLRAKRDYLSDHKILLATGERVRGTPVFEDLVADPPASEEQFRGLWKLYFLSLIGTLLRLAKFDDDASRKLISSLETAGLILPEWSLKRSLRAALDYVRRIDSISGEVKLNELSGTPEGLEAKITLREPGGQLRNLGYISADSLLEMADAALGAAQSKFWIALDRLDVAFADSPDLEGNALRALFRVYRDLVPLEHFSLKIFLRDDIWARITSVGFREASHITKFITITWEPSALLNLVIRRALHNNALREFYQVDAEEVLADAEVQRQLFYRIFPSQIDAGKRKSTALDWMLTRTMDGSGKTAPRELIHLLSAARDQQLRLLEMGAAEPPGEALFDRAALKNALPEVSKVRYQQTLCAEHPALKTILDQLEGQKTQQSPSSLARIWRVSEKEALTRAEKLCEVGFFQKRSFKDHPLVFWIPFLYRDALNLVQGQAG